jgi:hypothetical protein
LEGGTRKWGALGSHDANVVIWRGEVGRMRCGARWKEEDWNRQGAKVAKFLEVERGEARGGSGKCAHVDKVR